MAIPGIGAALSGVGGGVQGVGGPSEWSIPGVDGAGAAQPAGKSFGSVLGDQLTQLDKLQNDAASQAQSIADGTATDVTGAVMAVERARLSMQLASQLRTKGVEAINDIFHTTV